MAMTYQRLKTSVTKQTKTDIHYNLRDIHNKNHSRTEHAHTQRERGLREKGERGGNVLKTVSKLQTTRTHIDSDKGEENRTKRERNKYIHTQMQTGEKETEQHKEGLRERNTNYLQHALQKTSQNKPETSSAD